MQAGQCCLTRTGGSLGVSLRLIVMVTYHYRTEVVKCPVSWVPLDTVQVLLWQQWSFALKRSFISGSWAPECILVIWIAINKINSYFCQLQILWKNNLVNHWGLIQSCMFLLLVLLRLKRKWHLPGERLVPAWEQWVLWWEAVLHIRTVASSPHSAVHWATLGIRRVTWLSVLFHL